MYVVFCDKVLHVKATILTPERLTLENRIIHEFLLQAATNFKIEHFFKRLSQTCNFKIQEIEELYCKVIDLHTINDS